ncbi:myosin heavy chain, muscle [Folsomia candida]|uniref:myosin heavy chain, muscle n=1 Tax=Folsomia candida TaxID=158441 RepID=UPI000B9058F1|nr:myosin heavy chain, muscle [Folsomia candida]
MVIEQKFKEGEEPDPTQYLFISLEMKRADQTKPYDAKTTCWIPDDKECFALGCITGTKGDNVTVKLPDGNEKVFKKALVGQVNPPKYEKAEDMSNLTYLNDASVLHNLQQRYYNKLIYTYSGLFCVAINPYARYPIYTQRAMKIYHGRRRNEVPPHIFAIADGAYSEMMTNHQNQSILITGESGAGKTENTKKVIAYFASVGASGKPDEKKISLEDQIVQTNPVLEAFGNAKTTRNDNSSRFGKFIRIHFGPSGKLASADIEVYLLEKARVISQQPLERSYHIFYQIMTGSVKGLKEKLLLSNDILDYHFVSQGKTTVPSIDDFAELEQTHIAFEVLNFSEKERMNVYKITAGVMHMGNLKFKQQGREEQALPDTPEHGEKTGSMLGVEGEEMYNCFTKPRIKVGTEFVVKGQNVNQCLYAVGAMGKAIYDRMFRFLVVKCNNTLENQNKKQHFIGVLDIAGFEIFDFNSFEQLCINFTNEKLQQFFNHHMFVLEQEEYKKEGLDWIFEDFGMDLQACIDMMERPMGVFSILEEESMFPKATDQTFIEKLNINLLSKSPCFIKPRPAKPGQVEAHFACVHYAGTVPYNIANWLEKNKDPLNDTVVDLFKKGTNDLVQFIFADHPGQSGGGDDSKGGKKQKGSGFKTVSSGYREQLNNLMTTLKATHPHFIRCIIPNELKTPGLIDSHLVMHQLTCNGVLEGIRICRKGFPNRMAYVDFCFRYNILASKQMKEQKDDKKIATACFDHIGLDADKWRVGHTKVFFRAGVLGEMEELRDDKIAAIMVWMQSRIRSFLVKKHYRPMMRQRLALEVVQRSLRSYVKLRVWPWWDLWKILKPTLKVVCIADEIKKFEDRLSKVSDAVATEEALKNSLEAKGKKLESETKTVRNQLEELKALGSDFGSKIHSLNAQKSELDAQVNDYNHRLQQEEEARMQLNLQKKRIETEIGTMKGELEEQSGRIDQLEGDTAGKAAQIENLKVELSHQEDLIAKLTKEKKHIQDGQKKRSEDCQAQEDKMNHLMKIKVKLERAMDELEDNLEREKKHRCDIEKLKTKIESDLKMNQEALADLERNKKEIEQAIQRKDKEIASLSAKLEEENTLIAKLMRQIKELQARIDELEEELELERQARAKAAKARSDLAKELEDLGGRLEEAGGQTASQIELNKRRDIELEKLRREMEETNLTHEATMAGVRKKHNDAVAEMAERIDNLNKMKAKAEKDRGATRSELDELRATLDYSTNEKAGAQKLGNHLQQQLHEIQVKYDAMARLLNDCEQGKKKYSMDNNDLARQIEEAESTASQLSKVKVSLATQLEDTKRMADEESREKASLLGRYRNVEHDVAILREQFEEIAEEKSETQKAISKANAEAQLYRGKYESEGLAKIEELEGAKQKLQARLAEAEETIESLKGKGITLEKTKQRLTTALDDMRIEVDRNSTIVAQMEKKQVYYDNILHEWKNKVNDLAQELDASRKEARNYSTELFRTKALYEEQLEQIEIVRRENKNLCEEAKDIMEQINEGGRNIHELEKARQRIQVEKDELQAALEEAESAIEQEENKVLRVQLELSQVRQEIDRRIQEKEEEFMNTRKNYQRTLDSMQASLEAETNGRAEAIRMKKKLESDINELEIALDHANKSNAEAQKAIKKFIQQLKDVQTALDEEMRLHTELREEYGTSQRRGHALASELEESRTLYEQADRARRLAEGDLVTVRESLNEYGQQVGMLSGIKRKLDSELEAVHTELEGTLNEAKKQEEMAKKAMVDAARLADELRLEQEYANTQDKTRKSMEFQMKELQVRLEVAEADAMKGAKGQIAKLESKLHNIEAELDIEQRRHVDAQKNMRKCDRRVKELSFQSDEDRKNHEKMQDLLEKLQQKIRTYKRQIEEAEEIAALNLAKFNKAQQELDDITERAEQAEMQLRGNRPGFGGVGQAQHGPRGQRAPSNMNF